MSCTNVRRELVLPLDRDDAWDAVCDLERWLADEADLPLEPGASGELTLTGGEVRRATVQEVREGERLSFWWHAGDAPATLVEIELVDCVASTRVVVVESGWGAPAGRALARLDRVLVAA